MVIGLFNVISAIFVEATMAAASSLELSKKHERLADAKLWQKSVTVLITCFMEYCGLDAVDMSSVLGKDVIANKMAAIFDLEVGPEDFKKWVQDERVVKA